MAIRALENLSVQMIQGNPEIHELNVFFSANKHGWTNTSKLSNDEFCGSTTTLISTHPYMYILSFFALLLMVKSTVLFMFII